MKKKGLSTKLEFIFEEIEDVPLLNYETNLKKKVKSNKINIVKKKNKNGKDSSTNKRLF